MKSTVSRDLAKLKQYEPTLLDLLGDTKIKRWILLCPFLDDKAVVAFAKKKALELTKVGCALLDTSFEALIHFSDDFQTEIANLRHLSLGVPLRVNSPQDSDIEDRIKNLDQRLDDKLRRGFSNRSDEQRQHQKHSIVRSSLRSENLLEQMKLEMPELWDRATQSIIAEEDRLAMGGSRRGDPSELIDKEAETLNNVLQKALPTLNPSDLSVIAKGQIGTWLIQCPLDFDHERMHAGV